MASLSTNNISPAECKKYKRQTATHDGAGNCQASSWESTRNCSRFRLPPNGSFISRTISREINAPPSAVLYTVSYTPIRHTVSANRASIAAICAAAPRPMRSSNSEQRRESGNPTLDY
ncbi:unnamed protein product [Colias eurytheme]|nr:unnamed protein product [Colias eurytheme]